MARNVASIYGFGRTGNLTPHLSVGFFIFRKAGEEMKKIFVLIVCLVATNFAFAAEEKKESILGEAIDQTLVSLKGILTPSQRLDPIVVTPSRYEEPSLNVSKNVTVIDQEKIKRSNARYVPELLRNETGINVRSTIGNGKAVEVDIRGFGEFTQSNVLVLIDGRRTNQIDISGTDWAQININSIERIEIIRGPQTVLYGDNATGGVINIVTKTGAGKKPEAGFGYKTGSYRYNSFDGHVEGGTNFLDYYGSLSYSNTAGYRTNNNLETGDFNANITMKPSDILNIRFEGGYHKDWYGLPGALMPVNLDSVGWRGTIYPNDRAKTEDGYFTARPEFKYDTKLGQILFSGDIIARSRRTASVFFYSDGSNSEVNNHIRTFGITPKVAFTADVGSVRNRLIFGADYYGHKDEISSTNFTLGGKDRIIIEKDSIGVYVTDVIDLFRNLSFNTGYRAEWTYYTFDQQAMLAAVNKKSPFEYAAEAGINYKYNERSSIYANYARSFRFPAVDEWYAALYKSGSNILGGLNLNLTPQTGNNYEIGIKENSSKYVSLKADYFIMDLKHELFFNPVAGNYEMGENSVYDHTMRHGLELEAHTYLFDILDCFANYTYQKAFFVGSTFAGCDIPLVPHHKLSSGLNYKLMDCVNVNYVATFVSSRRFMNDQKNLMPSLKSYITHDIKLSYYKYGFEAFGALYNIFDEKYAEQGALDWSRTRPGYYPSSGKNYVIGVNYKF